MPASAGPSLPRRSSRFQPFAASPSTQPTTSAGKSRGSNVSQSKPRRRPKTQRQPSPTLYLRVNHKFLFLLPAATPNQPKTQPLPPLPGTTGNLNVIIATLPDLHPFTGGTVNWLIQVARLIFEPLGSSSLYTFTTQSLEWWLDREMDPSTWRQVVHGEQLRPTIYEFRPNNDALISLTNMSERHARSMTTSTSQPRASTFRATLLRRHPTCIISQHAIQHMLVASHLLPRRLGDAAVQSAIHRFTGSATIVDRYDPLLGVPLLANLGILTDRYELGFWNCGPNQYVVHNFLNEPLSLFGGSLQLFSNEPALHGHQVTLSTHDASLSLPPAGAFSWHYTQCVLKKFATDAYKAINNVFYLSLPFRTTDDDDESDVDFDDERNISNPPYPSYLRELAEWRVRQRMAAMERDHAVLAWNSGVSDVSVS